MPKRSQDVRVEAARQCFIDWGNWRSSIGEGYAKPNTQNYHGGTLSDFDHSDPVFKAVAKLSGRYRTRQMFCEHVYRQFPRKQGRVIWLYYVEGVKTLKRVSQYMTYELRREAIDQAERHLYEMYVEPVPGTVANTVRITGEGVYCPIGDGDFRAFTHDNARHAHKYALRFMAKCLDELQNRKDSYDEIFTDIRLLMKDKNRTAESGLLG